MTADGDHPLPRHPTTWAALVEQYERYRKMPRWGSMLRVPNADGEMSARHVRRMSKEGEAAVERVRTAIKRFEAKCGEEWPTSPELLRRDRSALDRLRASGAVGLRNVRSLWEVLVFDRDCYTCRYCGRDAFTFYERTGNRRTLRLVVDHRTAVGKKRGTFAMDNSVTACWSCNTLKGAFPENIFLQELDSIIESRLDLTAGKRPSQATGDEHERRVTEGDSPPPIAFSEWVPWAMRASLKRSDGRWLGLYLWARFGDRVAATRPYPVLPEEVVYVGETKHVDRRALGGRHHRLEHYRDTFPDDPGLVHLYVSICRVHRFPQQTDIESNGLYRRLRVYTQYVESRIYWEYTQRWGHPPALHYKKGSSDV